MAQYSDHSHCDVILPSSEQGIKLTVNSHCDCPVTVRLSRSKSHRDCAQACPSHYIHDQSDSLLRVQIRLLLAQSAPDACPGLAAGLPQRQPKPLSRLPSQAAAGYPLAAVSLSDWPDLQRLSL